MLYKDWCAAGQLTSGDLPINEEWISDALHFVGDVTAAVADVAVPGSGAVVDVINMLSYFVEAHLSTKELEQTKLIISGCIQAFAIFDPINAITVGLKQGLGKIFSAFSTRSPDAIATARVAADEVAAGLNLILTGLTNIANRLATSLSGTAFARAVKWLSQKLGISAVATWIKNFITQKAAPLIRDFLTKLRDTFNPRQMGATTAEGEFNNVLARNMAKLGVEQGGAAALHAKVTTFADGWKTAINGNWSQFYPDPYKQQRDNAQFALKPKPALIRLNK